MENSNCATCTGQTAYNRIVYDKVGSRETVGRHNNCPSVVGLLCSSPKTTGCCTLSPC